MEPWVRHELETKLVVQGGMIRQGNQRKLSSVSKIVFREEGPGSTVKIPHDNDIADKARNDLKDY